MGPTLKKKKQKLKKKNQKEIALGVRREDAKSLKFFLVFFFQIFFLRFTKICPSEFVGINTESALRDKGYA